MKVEIRDNSFIAGTYPVNSEGMIEGLERFANRRALIIIIDEDNPDEKE